jgi:putative DNA-invertase from lambdoid prophage Rac
MQKDLIAHRTKEALRSKKASGVHCEKPKGTFDKSKFDKDRDNLNEYVRQRRFAKNYLTFKK